MQTFALKWDENHLLEMLKWRWGRLYPPKPLAGVFSGDGLQIILEQASSNPRRLSFLWNEVWRNRKGLPISEADVQSAVEHWDGSKL